MKAAFPVWNDRIAPVFDVARHARIVERDNPDSSVEVALPSGSAMEKVAFLSQSGVTLLICGAISRSTQCAAAAYGIATLPFRAGAIDAIIDAWREDQLSTPGAFAMPGCGRGKGCGEHRGQGRGRRRAGRPGSGCADSKS